MNSTKISFKVSETLHTEIRTEATKKGFKSVSSFVRFCVEKQIESSETSVLNSLDVLNKNLIKGFKRAEKLFVLSALMDDPLFKTYLLKNFPEIANKLEVINEE